MGNHKLLGILLVLALVVSAIPSLVSPEPVLAQAPPMVQRGSYTETNTAALTGLINITAVPVGKSFVLHTVTGTTNPAIGSLTVELTTIVSGEYTQIQWTRGTAAQTFTLAWTVFTHTDLTVQIGTTYMPTVADNTKTESITAVNLGNTFLITSQRFGMDDTKEIIRGRFTSTTQLTFDRYRTTTGTIPAYVHWQVVTWAGATVQSGTGTITAASLAIPGTFDLATSFLMWSYRPQDPGLQQAITVADLQATAVNFRRMSSALPVVDVAYFVVSHPNLKVQRGSFYLSAGEFSKTATLSPAVDMAMSFEAANQWGNSRPYSGATWQRIAMRHVLTATDEITAYRHNATTDAAGGFWQVVTWSIPEPVAVTLPATNIWYNTTGLNGEIDDDDGADCEARFRYRVRDVGVWTETAWMDNGGAFFRTGHTFNDTVGGLIEGTEYEFQAQARNEATLVEGPWSTSRYFTTLISPIVVTNNATWIGHTGARLHGEVTTLGHYAEFQHVSFIWSDDPLFATFSDWDEELTPYPIAPFSWHHDITGLDPDTTYYFIAMASPDGITWYEGSVLQFDTLPITLPVATMHSITSITFDSARGWMIITDDGGALCARQFRVREVGTIPWTTGAFGGFNFLTGGISSTTWVGLTPVTQYEGQVRAQNSAGIGNWSASMTFWTAELMAVTDVTPVEDSTIACTTSVALSVNVTHTTGQNITVQFYDHADALIGTDTIASGGVATVNWTGLSCGDHLQWYVRLEDEMARVEISPAPPLFYNFYINNPPDISMVLPADGEFFIATPVLLRVLVDDVDGHDLTVTFYNAADDSIIHTTGSLAIDHPENVSYNWTVPAGIHRWYASADDGLDISYTATRTFNLAIIPPDLTAITHEFEANRVRLYGQVILNDVAFWTCTLYFEYREVGELLWDSTTPVVIAADGTYNALTAVLVYGANYEWRVALDFVHGIEYSAEETFTMAVAPILITILDPTDVDDSTAIARANIALGDHAGAFYWFLYGVHGTPTTTWSYAPYGYTAVSGIVTQQLLDLDPETKYGYYVVGIDSTLITWTSSAVATFTTDRTTAGVFHKLVSMFGINDEGGRLLFAILCIIIIPAIIYGVRRGLFIPMITATGLVGFFSVIGFIPLWVILTLVAGLVLGFWMVIRGAAATAGGDTE